MPSYLSLVGVFGGTGGHLHNVGFIFSPSLSPNTVNASLCRTTIHPDRLSLQHRLWTHMKSVGLLGNSPIGLFNGTERQAVEKLHREDEWRHADYVRFVGKYM